MLPVRAGVDENTSCVAGGNDLRGETIDDRPSVGVSYIGCHGSSGTSGYLLSNDVSEQQGQDSLAIFPSLLSQL